MEGKGRGAGVGNAEDMVEGMQCNDHPFQSKAGGICAFCLQEKLGRLVSKTSDPFFSAPTPAYSSSSSSPPTFSSSASSTIAGFSFASDKNRRQKKKKSTTAIGPIRTHQSASENSSAGGLVHKRSKEVTLRSLGSLADASNSPRKKTFWSFLTLSYSSPGKLSSKRRSTSSASNLSDAATSGGDLPKIARKDEKPPRREQDEASSSAAGDDTSPCGSHASSSFGCRVARSRSVGCGSRSFSGDFLERISNGFSLRRTESHREAKPKASVHRSNTNTNADDDEQRIKERVKCGGIFTGLGIISSSTYSLSASSAAAIALEDHDRLRSIRRGGAPRWRKSWGWAFVSPMRAFRQPAIIPGFTRQQPRRW